MDVNSLSTLLLSLAQPASPADLARGTATVQTLYTTPGFFRTLQTIALQADQPRDVRVLASLLAKNELVTRWRGKAVCSDDEKAQIRAGFYDFLGEPDIGIVRMQGEVMSKISRIDFPRVWPDLIEKLLQPLIASATSRLSGSSAPDAPERIVLRNSLWILNRVVKEWSMVRIPMGTKVMGELVQTLHPVLDPLLPSLIVLPRTLEAPEDSESAMLCFKLVSRLCVFEWTRPSSARLPGAEERIVKTFSTSTAHLHEMLGLRSNLLAHMLTVEQPWREGGAMLRSATKHCASLIKFFKRMEDVNPKGYATLPHANETVLLLWNHVKSQLDQPPVADQTTSPFPQNFAILSLQLLKDILPIWQASHPDVLTPEFISSTFTSIVERILLLSDEDVEGLEADPEEWCVSETASNEQWTYNMRACGERILLALNNACRNREDKVIEHLLQTKLGEALSAPVTDEASLKRKEAIYTAAGRLARSLVQNPAIPPSQFLLALAEETKTQSPEHRLLKRRIAWLVGELVDAEEELANSALPWELLLSLLEDHGPSSDVGVRLTAAGALKQAMDLWEMEASTFRPYVPRILPGLMRLVLEDLQLLEGKRRVLSVLEVLIERQGTDIVPFLGQISGCIPQLWEKAASEEGEWLFKSSLLSLATKMVEASLTNSHELSALCMGLLEQSLQGPARLSLEEDGMILWQAMLRHTSRLDAQLVQLAPVAINQLSSDPDSLLRCLQIVDSYVLLDGAQLYQAFSMQIAGAYKNCLEASTPADVLETLQSLALHIGVIPISGWGEAFVQTGLLTRLIMDAHQPNVGAALPYYTDVFARIILADAGMFLQMLAAANVTKASFLDLWWSAFDRIAQAPIRKRVAMASAVLLSTGDPDILQRFAGEFVNLFLDVLGELKEQAEDERSVKFHWRRDTDEPDLGDARDTAEGDRRLAVHERDPAFSTSLTAFIREKLSETPGLEGFVDVHDPAFNELQKYLST